MAEKTFYWLRLKRDFFKRHDIQVIEDMDNGKDYVLFYLKLLVESVDHDGYLRFSETIPYNEKMLATVTHTNIDIVRSALQAFADLEMIEVLDDQTIYMTEVEKMIGKAEADEHTRESGRIRAKRYRERKKLEHKDDVTVTLPSRYDNVIRNGEIEKEIEIEKDNIYTSFYHDVITYLNEKAGTSYRVNSTKTQGLIKARVNEKYTLEDFKRVIDNKVAEWKGTDLERYLRPETLFGTKFEGYLNQKVSARKTTNSFSISNDSKEVTATYENNGIVFVN